MAREKSPYLLQHAHNPVDWYPWGDEAFDRARSEDKPLFLSIGYSACHWCHVMEHESFEDPVVAALLNDVFVCVKVDREERPDVDHVYMAACQMITGSGGWPLTILMTPDAKPFFAATYVPKEDRFGRMGLLSLIPRIRDMWAAQRGEIKESAERIALSLVSESAAPAGEALDRGVLEFAYRQLVRRFDETNGGFGTAPKFPAAHNLLFLLRHWKRSGSPEALAMVETTLRSMRRGGIFDHIGFGFHRYSTDAEWRLPHFEKMLYDQAMLSLAYTEAYQATGDPDYRRTAEEILEYVLRDMTAPSGGFYSAEDADSEGEEGKFYVWSLNDLERILDADELGAIREIFELGEGGNFLDEATGQRSGYNLFHMRKAAPGRFGPAGAPENELRDRWEGMRKKLFASREERIHPRKDDKILTDWNGLMIAAFARAARAFGVREYGDAARRSAAFILGHMRTERGGLLHRYRDGEAAIRAAIDDYAFFMWGLIELYETTFDVGYLEAALNLYERFHEDFWDEREGGFFFTSKDGEKLLLRDKELYDAAVPSGNSAALFAMLRLSRMTADTGMEANAGRMSRSFSGLVGRNPAAYTFLLAAVDSLLGPAQEVVIVGGNDERGAQAMIDAVRKVYRPATVVLLKKEKDSVRLGKLAPFTEKLACIAGKATAYVCTNHTCDLPATSVDEMLKMLG